MNIKIPNELNEFFELNNINIKIEDLDVYEVENNEIITGIILDKENNDVLLQWEKNNGEFDLMGSLIDNLEE